MGSQSLTLDYEEMLGRAKSGEKLPSKWVECIRQQLASGRFEADPYTLIHILGRVGDASSVVSRKWLYIIWRCARGCLSGARSVDLGQDGCPNELDAPCRHSTADELCLAFYETLH
jgi:hypothetical protein